MNTYSYVHTTYVTLAALNSGTFGAIAGAKQVRGLDLRQLAVENLVMNHHVPIR